MVAKHFSLSRPAGRFIPIVAAFIVALLAGTPARAQFALPAGCVPVVNRPPVAKPDSAATFGTTAVTINVLANDSDPDGNPLTVVSITQPFSGSAVINAGKTVTYKPVAGFSGFVQFTYVISDGAGGKASSTIDVNVSSLVLALNFNEGAGAVANDSSGLGNKASITGAAWTPEGAFGGGLVFNGTSSIVTVAASPSLNVAQVTVEAWVQPADINGWRNVLLKQLSKSTASGLSYALYANSDTDGGAGAYIRPSGMSSDQRANDVTTISVGEWHHLAATYNGSALKLYVDGNLVATPKAATPLSTGAFPLFIGGNPLWGEFFKGTIDEVRVYNRALTDGEILVDMFTAVR